MLAVSSCLPAKRRSDLEENLELLWIEVNLGHCRAYIGSIYMNYPNINIIQALERSLDKVAAVANPNDVIMCEGDCNSWDIIDGDVFATATNKHGVCAVSERLLEAITLYVQ